MNPMSPCCRSGCFHLRKLGFVAPILGVLTLSGCGGVLDPRGPIGAANLEIMVNALEIMLVIVVPTLLATAAFAWWFRASNPRALYRPHFAYSGRVELVVWSIPLLVILFISGVIWIGAHRLDPYQPIESTASPLEVQVVSLDWKWLFIYPNHDIASVNELVVPQRVPVHFTLTSASVMNSFFVPQLGTMIATMNGMVTQLWLQADDAGSYHGLSTQFSGDGFPDMHFTVRAVSDDEFQRWIGTARQAGPALDRAAYTELSKQTLNVAPFTYRRVEPDLFHAVATQALPPGPGPSQGGGGPVVRPKTSGSSG